MGEFGIGQSVPRFEDPRLLRGQGRFVDDINLPGQAYMVVVRSPHAAARIRSIKAMSCATASRRAAAMAAPASAICCSSPSNKAREPSRIWNSRLRCRMARS